MHKQKDAQPAAGSCTRIDPMLACVRACRAVRYVQHSTAGSIRRGPARIRCRSRCHRLTPLHRRTCVFGFGRVVVADFRRASVRACVRRPSANRCFPAKRRRQSRVCVWLVPRREDSRIHTRTAKHPYSVWEADAAMRVWK